MSVAHRTSAESDPPAGPYLSQPPISRTAPPSPGDGPTVRPQLPAAIPAQERSELGNQGRVRRTCAGALERGDRIGGDPNLAFDLRVGKLQHHQDSLPRVQWGLSLAVALQRSVVGALLLVAIPVPLASFNCDAQWEEAANSGEGGQARRAGPRLVEW